jgi:uncharacterized protein (TIGR03067 family)
MSATSSAPSLTGTKPRTDLERLQGVWTFVSGPREVRLLVAGPRYAFEFVGGDLYMGTFVLDPYSDPKRMDMRIDEGPAAHRGQVALCIYHLEGDLLRWCPARLGADERLTGFPGVDDERHLCTVFKRVPARRGG